MRHLSSNPDKDRFEKTIIRHRLTSGEGGEAIVGKEREKQIWEKGNDELSTNY